MTAGNEQHMKSVQFCSFHILVISRDCNGKITTRQAFKATY